MSNAVCARRSALSVALGLLRPRDLGVQVQDLPAWVPDNGLRARLVGDDGTVLTLCLCVAAGSPPKTLLTDKTAATLVDQIQNQRLLTMAENNNLSVSVQLIDSLDFLRGILAKWQDEGEARHLKLVVNTDSMPVGFSSDKTILSHVLNSMVKNAFDASSRGMEIALGCYAENQTVVFRVRNSTVMTEDVQLQVFLRSFSTRGAGRGLGTYSMKLLTEHYLGGKIGFSSGGSDGTVFYVRLPLSPPGTPK